MKDSNFYNQESSQYSTKRYPRVTHSYIQFFFKRRLAITLGLLRKAQAELGAEHTLLEIGCADGVIIQAIENAFPHVFNKLIGIDIAAGMVAEAQKRNTTPHAEFYARSAYANNRPVGVVVETGVANYANVNEEVIYAHNALVAGGWYILSLAGTDSLLNKLKTERDFADFRSYKEYEWLIQEYFVIHSVRGCGFFVPYLWRVPFLARIVQTIIDPLLGVLLPALCHEKVYLLEKK